MTNSAKKEKVGPTGCSEPNMLTADEENTTDDLNTKKGKLFGVEFRTADLETVLVV